MPLRDRLRQRDRRFAWKIAREAWLESQQDRRKAVRLIRQRVRNYAIDPMTIWLIIKVAIWIIDFFIRWYISNPPKQPMQGAPGFGGPEPTAADYQKAMAAGGEEPDEAANTEDEEPSDMWGTPPLRPGREYSRAGYSPRGQLNGRDIGSIGANFLQAQGLIIPAAAAIETLAENAVPNASTGAFFTAAYLLQSITFLVLKVAASWLRNHGESVVRNLFAWGYERLMGFLRNNVWPFTIAKKRAERKERRKKRRRNFWDRWRRR